MELYLLSLSPCRQQKEEEEKQEEEEQQKEEVGRVTSISSGRSCK